MASSDHEQEAPLAGESEEEEQDRPHETWPEMRARHNREMRVQRLLLLLLLLPGAGRLCR